MRNDLPRRRREHIDARHVERPVPPRLKPRGVPSALLPHEVFVTDDPAAAGRASGALFGDHRVELRPSGHEFLASLHSVRLRDVTVGYLDFVAAVDLTIAALPDDYTVFMAMNGEAHVTNLDRIVSTNAVTAAVPHPRTPASIRWGELSPHLVVTVSARALHLHLSRLLGRSVDQPVRFDLELPLGHEEANRWSSAIQLVQAELFHDDSLLHDGVGIGPLEEFLMSALLYAHRSNYSATLADPYARPGRRAVRAAVDYIEQHLGERFTLADVATAAQCSVRSLQVGFQVELRTTPWSYVRDRRLERVRSDLLDADGGDDVSVTDVAVRWGFSHLGRFAGEYRARFGELPSQTLRS